MRPAASTFLENFIPKRGRSGLWMLTLSGICTLTHSVEATAQQTGTRLGRNATPKDGTTAVRMIAECYYNRNPKHVVAWLNMLPGDAEEVRLLQHDAENMTPCLDSDKVVFGNVAVHFTPAAMRRPLGAVMARRYLLKVDHPSAPAPDAKPWFHQLLVSLPPKAPVDRISLSVQDFGHCVAVARWDDSLALLRSVDDSVEERAAVDRMLPALGACLDSGNSIKITRRNLREMIGEPVYHLLQATVVQQSGSN